MSSKADIKKQVNRALEEEKPASRLRQKKAELRKKRRKRLIWAAAAVIFCYLGYLLFVPYKGGMNFGICKVFLELHVKYPNTLRLSTVEDFGNSFRIWFTRLDPYGEYRLDQIQCYYRPDEKTGSALDKVTINRRPVDQETVEDFNRSIPVILAHPPDLTLPTPIPDSLEEIEIQTDTFRRQIFN